MYYYIPEHVHKKIPSKGHKIQMFFLGYEAAAVGGK
jgi:hypothetical protein